MTSRLVNGGYPIGPAPLGWNPIVTGGCSRVIPHVEGDVCENADLNADHYEPRDMTDIAPDTVLMFQNENADNGVYPDALVVVERVEGSPGASWSGRRVWVTRLGGARMDPLSRWSVGFFAHVRELSPVSVDVLEAIGGRI